MPLTVKHTKVSAIPDDPAAVAAGEVVPSDWNADHPVTGTLDIANGGTGQATAANARNALLPSQSGSGGALLTTDGTNVGWAYEPLVPMLSYSGNFVITAGMRGYHLSCTNTITATIDFSYTFPFGFKCWISNDGSGNVTIDPASSETIDGQTTLILRPGEGLEIFGGPTLGVGNWNVRAKQVMRGYAENFASSAPRPTASGTDTVALGRSSTASGSSALALGRSAVANNTYATAVGYATTASGFGAATLGYAPTASSNYAVAIGATSAGSSSQAITGAGAVAIGGGYSSGSNSFAASISNNTSTYGATNTSAIAVGYLSRATNTYSCSLNNGYSSGAGAMALGYASAASGIYANAFGYGASASGSYAVALGIATSSGNGSTAIGVGYSFANPTASATSSVAIGDGSTANATYSVAFGLAAQALGIIGRQARSNGRFAASGDSQIGEYILRRATTDATATVLTTDNTAPGADDQIILPNSSAYAFTGTVVARQQGAGGTASAAWKIEGLIRREGTAATTTLVASTVTAISNVPAWAVALSADTTNGGLAITVTGAAATNIRWVATVQTNELTYA